MNYTKIYNQIIEKRRNNTPTGYIERHHILPRSLGGSDDEDNIVALTAREHFICHFLLIKMYKVFLDGEYRSIRELSSHVDMSVMTISKRFNRYIPEYANRKNKRILVKKAIK